MKPSPIGAAAAEAVGAGGVGGGEPPAEVGRLVGGLLAGVDPGDHEALVVDGEHRRHRDAVLDLGEPAQPGRLGGEEAGGRAGEGLHQGRGAVAEAQLGGGGDVAAGDRRGGHDGGPEQRLRAAGDRRLTGHPRPVGAVGAVAQGQAQGVDDALARPFDHRQHLLEAAVATVVRIGHLAARFDGVEVTEQPHPLGAAPEVGEVLLVHRQQRGRAARSSRRPTAARGAGSGRSPRRRGWRRRGCPSGGRGASRRCRCSRRRPGRRARPRRAGARAPRGPWGSGRCCRGRPAPPSSGPGVRAAGGVGVIGRARRRRWRRRPSR